MSSPSLPPTGPRPPARPSTTTGGQTKAKPAHPRPPINSRRPAPAPAATTTGGQTKAKPARPPIDINPASLIPTADGRKALRQLLKPPTHKGGISTSASTDSSPSSSDRSSGSTADGSKVKRKPNLPAEAKVKIKKDEFEAARTDFDNQLKVYQQKQKQSRMMTLQATTRINILKGKSEMNLKRLLSNHEKTPGEITKLNEEELTLTKLKQKINVEEQADKPMLNKSFENAKAKFLLYIAEHQDISSDIGGIMGDCGQLLEIPSLISGISTAIQSDNHEERDRLIGEILGIIKPLSKAFGIEAADYVELAERLPEIPSKIINLIDGMTEEKRLQKNLPSDHQKELHRDQTKKWSQEDIRSAAFKGPFNIKLQNSRLITQQLKNHQLESELTNTVLQLCSIAAGISQVPLLQPSVAAVKTAQTMRSKQERERKTSLKDEAARDIAKVFALKWKSKIAKFEKDMTSLENLKSKA